MPSQRIEETAQPLEVRVATLEAELRQIKHILATPQVAEIPWWQKVAGSFENDPTFDEAVRLGKEWRESAE